MNDDYNNKLTKYFNSITNMKYLFEITKCCGYSEFVSVYKEYTFLNDLYKNVHLQFHMNELNNLWIINRQTGERLLIPNDGNICLKDFILNNNNYFIPVYPLPAKVVYKIYFDSGLCHNHDDINNINVICLPCVLHT
jgi:hypothetical protein